MLSCIHPSLHRSLLALFCAVLSIASFGADDHLARRGNFRYHCSPAAAKQLISTLENLRKDNRKLSDAENHQIIESFRHVDSECLKTSDQALLETLLLVHAQFPCDLKKIVTKDGVLPPLIFVPDNHGDKKSKALKQALRDEAKAGKIYLFDESVSESETELHKVSRLSLEDSLIYALVTGPGQVLRWMQSDRDPDRSRAVQTKRLLGGHVLHTIVRSPMTVRLLGALEDKKVLKDFDGYSENEKSAVAFFLTAARDYLKSSSRDERTSLYEKVQKRVESLTLDEYRAVVSLQFTLANRAFRIFEQEAFYPGTIPHLSLFPNAISSDGEDLVTWVRILALELRDQVFFRSIARGYCRYAKDGLPFFVEVGAKHIPGLVNVIEEATQAQTSKVPMDVTDLVFEYDWFKNPDPSDKEVVDRLRKLHQRLSR